MKNYPQWSLSCQSHTDGSKDVEVHLLCYKASSSEFVFILCDLFFLALCGVST